MLSVHKTISTVGELSVLRFYVIDIAAGDKIPRKGGPGITRSDLLAINKIDLAPLCRRRSFGHGPGRQAYARGPAVLVYESEGRCGRPCRRGLAMRPPLIAD